MDALEVLKQSKVDAMNDAIADYIIKRLEALSPLAAPDELESIAQLARVVNDTHKPIHMTSAVLGKPIKLGKRKRRR
ncbi:hypothetical protein LXM56_10575 [Lysinibacillus fusiformis]|uniref:hypothetical protein n=1 Tax=Lysinibacillus fusiformis TaxID=28031 RepID=UPI001E3D7FB8|nr:hypothetical protein [Lysinibacillus fusiformis]MCE4044571.1 hypothetical protein [Lysinibacillus fusiformis]